MSIETKYLCPLCKQKLWLNSSCWFFCKNCNKEYSPDYVEKECEISKIKERTKDLNEVWK